NPNNPAADLSAIAPEARDEKPAANVEPKPPEQKTSEQKPGGQETVGKIDYVSLSKSLKKAMKEAIEKKQFKRLSGATNGLSVATKAVDLDEGTRIALVAIKNVEDAPLRILPGHPELVVETVNEQGKVIQLTPIKKQIEETTAKSNLIPARGTVY